MFVLVALKKNVGYKIAKTYLRRFTLSVVFSWFVLVSDLDCVFPSLIGLGGFVRRPSEASLKRSRFRPVSVVLYCMEGCCSSLALARDGLVQCGR